MFIRNLLPIMLTLSLTTIANAETSFERFAIKQLRCLERPRPLPIFIALEKAGKIRADEMLGFDSVSCFRIHGGIKIRGMKFVSVCGHEEDRAIRNSRSDLLWRGPGTSPGQFISFGTNANFGVVSKWYFSNVGKQRLNQAIETEYTNIGDPTEITCSSWMQ